MHKKFILVFCILTLGAIIFMSYWGTEQKSGDDPETIEEAIVRIIAGSNVFQNIATWGALIKSQTDNETIEGAIARLIQAHDDDANAHIEAGQSLQSHKASEIVDHLAGSVVRDKLWFDRFEINEHFSSLDAWNKYGLIFLSALSQVEIDVDNTEHTSQLVFTPIDPLEEYGSKFFQPRWSGMLKIESPGANLVALWGQYMDAPAGYGFKYEGNILKWFYINTSSEEVKGTVAGIDVTNLHTYALEVDADDIAHWYVDGSEVYQTAAANMDNIGSFAWFEISNGVTNDDERMWVVNWHYDEELH